MEFRFNPKHWGTRNKKRVKIGDKTYESIARACLALGKSSNYINKRLKLNNGFLPDGTKIEVLDD